MKKQFIIFKLGNEQFGIEIVYVDEIIKYKYSTKIPGIPNYVEGVIDLRKKIIPVINLKKKLNFRYEDRCENNEIMIVNLEGKELGFLIDNSSYVVTLDLDQIDELPNIDTEIGENHIKGVCTIQNKSIRFLDLEGLYF